MVKCRFLICRSFIQLAMRNDKHRSYQKPNRRMKKILQLMLAAYFLLSIGLFSWVPLFLFQHGDTHRVTIQNSGQMISWTMHHIGEKPHDAASDNLVISQPTVHDSSNYTTDHVLATPSDDFVQHTLKIVDQSTTLIIFLGFLLFPAFFIFLKFLIPRDTGSLPVFNVPIRNSISILTRTVVLRH
jgi:hypothetical protein